MASLFAHRSIALALVVVAAVSVTGAAAGSKSINITNSCMHTVWPEISSAPSSAAPNTTGFELAPGQWEVVPVPSGWSGRVWGRALCNSNTTDDSSGKFTCITGDCGSGKAAEDCAGGKTRSVEFTLDGGTTRSVEFTLDGSGGDTTYAIVFCPSTTSGKLSESPNSQPPGTGNTTAAPCTGGGAAAPWRLVLIVAVLGAVTAALALVTQVLVLLKLCWNQQAAAGAGG